MSISSIEVYYLNNDSEEQILDYETDSLDNIQSILFCNLRRWQDNSKYKVICFTDDEQWYFQPFDIPVNYDFRNSWKGNNYEEVKETY